MKRIKDYMNNHPKLKRFSKILVIVAILFSFLFNALIIGSLIINAYEQREDNTSQVLAYGDFKPINKLYTDNGEASSPTDNLSFFIGDLGDYAHSWYNDEKSIVYVVQNNEITSIVDSYKTISELPTQSFPTSYQDNLYPNDSNFVVLHRQAKLIPLHNIPSSYTSLNDYTDFSNISATYQGFLVGWNLGHQTRPYISRYGQPLYLPTGDYFIVQFVQNSFSNGNYTITGNYWWMICTNSNTASGNNDSFFGNADNDSAVVLESNPGFFATSKMIIFNDTGATGYQNSHHLFKAENNYMYSIASTTAYTTGYNDGVEVGYDNGYENGESTGYSAGYTAGYQVALEQDETYQLGYEDGYNVGETTGYNQGYSEGSTGMSTNPFKLISNAFDSVASILNIQVLPNLTLGVLVFTPLIVILILVVVKFLRG